YRPPRSALFPYTTLFRSSIGLGIGIEVRWGSARIGLHASALLLVGLSTSPLVIAGKFKIEGELKLLVYSLSASADLDFRHDDSRSEEHTSELQSQSNLVC